MRLRPLTAAAIILLATLARTARAAPDETQPGAPAKPLVAYTRQNAYTIPFRIEPPKMPGQQPLEVQLHVSTDQGTTWQLSARIHPAKGAFVYRAPHDGEYWYSIRTVDPQGIARPEGPLEPQLKVTVDTVAPRLDLSVLRGEGGEIVARWQAVDPHLKPGSFKLEYQINATGPWERVAVEQPPDAMRHTLTGEATWWPKTSGDSVHVRAAIDDLSGNPAVNQAVIKLNGPATANDLAPRGTSGETSRGDRATTQSNRDATRRDHDKDEPVHWPADRSTRDPLARATGPDPRGGDGLNRDANWRDRGPAGADRPASRRPSVRSASQSRRGGRSNLDFSLLPAGERARMVNSRSFELEYEVDSVGPSGIGKVEVWGTRDGGRSWSVFGVDTDNRSPITVGVDSEGIYGFRVVIHSGSGLGGRPPADGDVPDIWIGVDLTKPLVRITSAEVDPETMELAIRWEASDDVPDARPISLSFGSGAQGPWTPIASGLENVGEYRWRLDSRVPDRIYLRLEARDEAGNVGAFETPEPVSLDRHRPEGRIRGVRPLGQ